MASCVDDCLYYKVCSDFRGNICERDLYRFMEYRMTSDGLCEHFKNKADVVEVVRCKECKHCELRYPVKAIGEEPIEGYYCCPNQRYVKSTDFCNCGERSENNGKKVKG